MDASKSNTLYVWYLAKPSAPELVGHVTLLHGQRRCGFAYSEAWLDGGFDLAWDMPRAGQGRKGDQLLLPLPGCDLHGALDDALPDRWGRLVIQTLDQPARLSALDYLYYAGDESFGALGFSLSGQHYMPGDASPLPSLVDADALYQLSLRIAAHEQVEARLKRLLQPGKTLGGARPKALIRLDGVDHILKFSQPGDLVDVPVLEYASFCLAKRAGITLVADARLLPVVQGQALAVRRFDRVPHQVDATHRVHALSAKTMLLQEQGQLSYPHLADAMRRFADVAVLDQQRHALFRRMVFNLLIENTDDHERNHVFLRNADGAYALSPLFDVSPQLQGLHYQGLALSRAGAEATVENALIDVARFGLSRHAALEIVAEVAAAVAAWRPVFCEAGMSDHDVEVVARFLDSPRLRSMREQLPGPGRARGR